MATKQQNTFFARELQKLNPAQREAVETIEGPVMIVAGPGTGKTQVVAMRIGQILQRTQLNARNILALTFTEAGVTTLRQRVERIVGPDAYQVTISTFHAFANDVVTTFPYLFGFVVEATQVTELERLQIIHRILEGKEDLAALRPVRSPTFHVTTVADAIRKLKQENIEPATLRDLAEQEFTQKNDVELSTAKQHTLERQKELNFELAIVFSAYQDELKRRNLYDYEDMILFALSALKNEPDVRAYYQERYQYILVDEYQDTNNAQNALVESLANFYEHPNLCVVGDDKQAIYRFQGASVANMLHFANKYAGLKIVSLTENYRSTAPILEAAGALIGYNKHQLAAFLPKLRTDLVATRTNSQTKQEFVTFQSEEAEFAWVIETILELHSLGVPLSEFAVLFRKNDAVKRFRSFALKSKLPVAGSETTNLIVEPEVQQLLRLLEAIDNPGDVRSLVSALHLVAGLSPITLARLARELDGHWSLKTAVTKLKLDKGEQSLVEAAVGQIGDWAASQKQLGLFEFVEGVVSGSRLVSQIKTLPSSLERLELLKGFLIEVKRFATSRPTATLHDFVDYIGLLRDYRLRLSVPRLLPSVEGVFLGTVHGSKGLEFDTVFMSDVSLKAWNDRGKRELIKLPSGIISSDAWDSDPIEDERRLFYVGLTRAKNALFCTMSILAEEGREVAACQFISEIGTHMVRRDLETSVDQADQIVLTTLSPASSITLQDQEERLVRELIADKPFSFTDYKAYLVCPQQYLLRSILRFPTKPEPRLVYGSLLHRALELFYKQYRTRKRLPGVAVLIGFLDQAAKQVENFSGKKAITEQARELLVAYHATIAKEQPLPVGVEYSFTDHHVMLGDIWLTGKFDRIDPLDGTAQTVRVIDYKTGSQAKTRNDIDGKTKSSDGKLREQLVFYSLIASLDRHFPYRATEFSLQFLDDDHMFREEVFQIESTERDKLSKSIIDTYREIAICTEFAHKRKDFDQGCEICELFRSL